MIRLMKSGTAIVTSFALALSPLALSAQTLPEPDAEQLAALRALIAATQGSSEIAEQLRQLNASVEALQAQVARDAEKVAALESAIATMAETVVSVEEVSQQVETQLAGARAAAQELADREFAGLVNGLGDAIENAGNIASVPEAEALQLLENTREAAQALRDRLEQEARDLQARLDVACVEAIPEDTRAALAAVVGTTIPQNWTADLAARAAEFGISLPECFSTPDESGQTVEDDVADYLAKQQASQAMATAMNSLMMMAMSTGNPYIIAGAMLLMALMAIFGDAGGGGGSDGEGSGGEQPADGGRTAGTGGGTDPNPGEGPPGNGGPESQPVLEPPPVAEQPNTGVGGYQNVVPGLDTRIDVADQVILLTDIATGTQWSINWPDFFFPLVVEIPDFNDSVRILAANAVERTITVELEVPGCDVRQTFNLTASSGDSSLLVLDGESNSTCLGSPVEQ